MMRMGGGTVRFLARTNSAPTRTMRARRRAVLIATLCVGKG
jgi:hypothetical protein